MITGKQLFEMWQVGYTEAEFDAHDEFWRKAWDALAEKLNGMMAGQAFYAPAGTVINPLNGEPMSEHVHGDYNGWVTCKDCCRDGGRCFVTKVFIVDDPQRGPGDSLLEERCELPHTHSGPHRCHYGDWTDAADLSTHHRDCGLRKDGDCTC